MTISPEEQALLAKLHVLLPLQQSPNQIAISNDLSRKLLDEIQNRLNNVTLLDENSPDTMLACARILISLGASEIVRAIWKHSKIGYGEQAMETALEYVHHITDKTLFDNWGQILEKLIVEQAKPNPDPKKLAALETLISESTEKAKTMSAEDREKMRNFMRKMGL